MTHTKAVTKVGRNDYEVTVDGGIIGFTTTMIAGIELADVHIIDLVQHESRAVVASADTDDGFETTITVVTERGLVFVIVDDGKTEKHHRVLDADEVAAIIRKRGISSGNIYSENISDGFMRRVRTLSMVDSDTATLIELESAAGCNYFETLDSAPIAPTLPRVSPRPIFIHSVSEAALACAVLKRRKQAFHAA